jgi:hypothetical protein
VQTLADMVHLETEDLADLAHHNVKAVQRRRLGRAMAFAKVSCRQRSATVFSLSSIICRWPLSQLQQVCGRTAVVWCP